MFPAPLSSSSCLRMLGLFVNYYIIMTSQQRVKKTDCEKNYFWGEVALSSKLDGDCNIAQRCQLLDRKLNVLITKQSKLVHSYIAPPRLGHHSIYYPLVTQHKPPYFNTQRHTTAVISIRVLGKHCNTLKHSTVTAFLHQVNTEQPTPLQVIQHQGTLLYSPTTQTDIATYHQYKTLHLAHLVAHLSIEVVAVFVRKPDFGVIGVGECVGLDPVLAARVPSASRHHTSHQVWRSKVPLQPLVFWGMKAKAVALVTHNEY